jgi:hypothetical protein
LQTQPESQHTPSQAVWPAVQHAVPLTPVVHVPPQQEPLQQFWPALQQTPTQAR